MQLPLDSIFSISFVLQTSSCKPSCLLPSLIGRQPVLTAFQYWYSRLIFTGQRKRLGDGRDLENLLKMFRRTEVFWYRVSLSDAENETVWAGIVFWAPLVTHRSTSLSSSEATFFAVFFLLLFFSSGNNRVQLVVFKFMSLVSFRWQWLWILKPFKSPYG